MKVFSDRGKWRDLWPSVLKELPKEAAQTVGTVCQKEIWNLGRKRKRNDTSQINTVDPCSLDEFFKMYLVGRKKSCLVFSVRRCNRWDKENVKGACSPRREAMLMKAVVPGEAYPRRSGCAGPAISPAVGDALRHWWWWWWRGGGLES